jgi:hypothetical protein
MYAANDRSKRDNTGTPLATLCKPRNFVQVVVGAVVYRNGGEPFHISKISWRRRIGSRENLLDNPVQYLKHHSHLYYTMAWVVVRLER